MSFARSEDISALSAAIDELKSGIDDLSTRASAPASPLAEFEQRLVVLQTKDGYSFRGLARFTPECVVLSAAERVDVEKPLQLGGEVVVLKQNMSFFQTIIETQSAEGAS